MTRLFTTMLAVALTAAAVFAQDSNSKTDDDKKSAMTEPEYVRMTTNKGEIILELNREKAPISTANFMKYVEAKYYDGTIFHRVIPTFMIQGGGFTADMEKKEPRDPIKNEWQNGLKNDRGTIAMARTSAPDSATSQFYINVVDNAMLDEPRGGAAYAVFGKVIAGMDVVDEIRHMPTTRKPPHGNVPVETALIERARKISKDDAMKAAKKSEQPDEKPASTQPGR